MNIDIASYYENYIDEDKSCVLTMCDGDEILGYITLRSPADDPSERRIGFVIVDDSMRGRGLVKALVSMTADYAFTELDATKVFFGIFENSISAIHCYEAVVFRCVSRPEI